MLIHKWMLLLWQSECFCKYSWYMQPLLCVTQMALNTVLPWWILFKFFYQKNSADSCSFMNNNPVGEKYQTYLHKYGSQLCVFRLRSMVREAFVMSVICKPPFLPPVMFWRKKIINNYYLRTIALFKHIYWMQDPQIMETKNYPNQPWVHSPKQTPVFFHSLFHCLNIVNQPL